MKKRHVAIGIAIAALILLAVGLSVAGRLWWSRSLFGAGLRLLPRCALSWRLFTMSGLFSSGFLGLLFGALLIGGLAWLLTGASDQREALPQQEDPSLQILRRRYAGGEITDEEFERMKELLQS